MSSRQYGEQIGFDKWRGHLTHNEYTSEEAMIHYERRAVLEAEAPRQKDESTSFSRFTSDTSTGEQLSADEVKAAVNKLALERTRPMRDADLSETIAAFTIRHPEYEDDMAKGSIQNGAKMQAFLISKGKQHNVHIEDLEEAFEHLSAAGALKLKPLELAIKQDQEAALRAASTVTPLNQLSEDQLYAMPMAELERRAKGFL